MNNEQRPEVGKIFSGLKDFQRQTAEYVFRRLYLDPDRVNRFLIADEVGLGKTLVAKGVIARAVEHLWDEVKRIDIVYICSNQDIARQNVKKINITKDREPSTADRMTLLPLSLHQFQDRKLNFVSFTPGTSFELHSSGGRADERALLYHLLRQGGFLGKESGPKNLFQCGAGKENWRGRLENFDPREIDSSLAQGFFSELNKNENLKSRLSDLISRFSHYRQYLPEEDVKERNQVIGELRGLLAQCCVQALEPDLVILDEFQRFKDLLDPHRDDEASRLAQTLFRFQDAQDRPVKIILLSATPYKMFTLYDEKDQDDHYEDFLNTVGFLFDSPEHTQAFQRELEQYSRGLKVKGLKAGADAAFLDAKKSIEKKLRRVMVRTERLSVTGDRNGMLIESRSDLGQLTARELNSFAALDRVTKALEVGDALEYWKSMPYCLNLMADEYELKRELKKRIEPETVADDLGGALSQASEFMLSWKDINRYQKIDPTNAKLRTLIENTLDPGAWKLLWVPPSLPYYRVAQGPYADPNLSRFSKALVFSSWTAAPKIIATLCSYEAERQIYSLGSKRKYEERKAQKGLINFTLSPEGRRTGMSNFTLIFPCLTLAFRVDPLEICARLAQPGALPDQEQVLAVITEKIRELLEPLISKMASSAGPIDERWYWAALALMDKKYFSREVREWLDNPEEDLSWSEMVAGRGGEESDSQFSDHVGFFREFFEGTHKDFGPPPEDLFEVLAKAALASPAVTALRSLARCFVGTRLDEISMRPHLLASAAQVALGFRALFNRPDAMAMIRGLRELDEESYWREVLNYGVNGNLQSVMDEYVHILREALGLQNDSAEKAVKEIGANISEAAALRTVPLQFDEFDFAVENQVRIQPRRIRCSFALRFGDSQDETGQGVTRKEHVRQAFNSPFRPFILATTSIGQEGLDFHQYCHEIYHWNLPGNPVDLEQREGRIHRYKGHAIRRNIAQSHGLEGLAGKITFQTDPWDRLFDMAKAARKTQSDLVPYWICEVADGQKIIRHIPALPMSRDLERLGYLKNSMAVYRLALGQPRQEDLVKFLQAQINPELAQEDIDACRIELAPDLDK